MGRPLALIPTVIESSARGERHLDIFSMLLRERIVYLGDHIDGDLANTVIAQLLYLDREDPDRDISLYINSPGGSVYSVLAMYDTMRLVRPDVSTICCGEAASGAAVLLAAGQRGKRFALPSATVLMHQPWSGAQGQASDIDIAAREIIRLQDKVRQIISGHTGQPYDKVARDTDRDYFMTSEEARAYGLIDEVLAGGPTGEDPGKAPPE